MFFLNICICSSIFVCSMLSQRSLDTFGSTLDMEMDLNMDKNKKLGKIRKRKKKSMSMNKKKSKLTFGTIKSFCSGLFLQLV